MRRTRRPVSAEVGKHPEDISQGRLRLEGDESISSSVPAKINLNLLVGPRGADGFHPVDSLVVRITLFDRLHVQPRDDERIVLHCQGADCGPDEDNLVMRAARALAKSTRVPGADITLDKRIPPGKGLGGGASDAACALESLNELWQLGLDGPQLAAIAADLGSDVPLFLGPPAARMTGRGERVVPLRVHPFRAVLIVPDLLCRTSDVYEAFDYAPEPKADQLAPELLARPASTWRDRLVNQLAEAAMRTCPPLRRLYEHARQTVNLPVHVTGSGSAMFVLCDEADEADALARKLNKHLPAESLVVKPNAW